jgi:(4S)-4-hydroxy-5-phosphonooxypentane-2,3-dione isomerase
MKKVITARITVKPDAIEQFLSYAKVIVLASNLEQGCLVYKLYQETDNPSSFIFYEEYENQEAVDFHNSTNHFKIFIGQIGEILAEAPVIEVF